MHFYVKDWRQTNFESDFNREGERTEAVTAVTQQRDERGCVSVHSDNQADTQVEFNIP